MWIVRLALRRPYTFVVMCVAILLLGVVAIVTMPIDIFPYIDIPVVSVVWNYAGMSPSEMESRILTVFERGMTTTVNDIEHIESQSYYGVSVVHVYFQPNVKIDLAMSQISAIANVVVRAMPPGIFPPNVLKYDASSVPIIQLGLESKTLSEQEIQDLGQNFIRTPLATVQGASVPGPYGGKQRQVVVDLDPNALYAKQLSPIDVSSAFSQQNLIVPAGTIKVGDTEYAVRVNSSPEILSDLNNLPVKTVNGATVYLKDVATVRDGFSVQTNIVRTNGTRGALLTILRNGQASTLDIVNKVKAALPRIEAAMPPGLTVRQLFDQSVFVRASISGVVREAAIAALLTGLMILLFLGSWRSTVIVCISIPLSILTSLIILKLMGHTINVMTLGGLALAVGILVDDATVEIENTHRNLAMKKPLVRAVLDGAQQIAIPAFVSTLSICIVFAPVLLLTGAAKFLFTPLALAVVFAMLASYMLSRTLIPTMVHYMLKPEVAMYRSGEHGEGGSTEGHSIIWRVHFAFNRRFERLRASYTGFLDWALDHRAAVLSVFLIFSLGSLSLVYLVGRDFFPTVDSGQIRLHAQAPAGTRIEKTELIFAEIEKEIRNVIPPSELDTILDNIGVPPGGFNLAFGDNTVIGENDGDILISLHEDHTPTDITTQRLRKRLNERFPDVVFFFEAANITNQILNSGLPAPIDVQVTGRDQGPNYALARQLEQKIARIPGAVDVHIHQVVDAPELRINVNRVKAGQLGLTQNNVASSLLISLSGSSQVAPSFWLNWKNGVSYNVLIQTPQYKLDSLDKLMRTPISTGSAVAFNTPGATEGAANQGDASTGVAPNQSSEAYGNPGALPYQTQSAVQRRHHRAQHRPGDRESLQRAAGVRRVCQYRPQGPGRRDLPSGKDHRADQDSQDHADLRARPGRDHAEFLLSSGLGTAGGHRPGISVNGRQFSVLGGSVHYSDCSARRAGWNPVDALCYTNHLECSVVDGRHHVYRSGHRQQYSNGGLRKRRKNGRQERARGGSVGWLYAPAAGFDDGASHDSRHAPHGARDWRGRGAKLAAGPGGDRRPAVGHRDHVDHRADRLQLYAQTAAHRS